MTETSAAGVNVKRFRFFPRRWEDLADGAIIENLRNRPSRWLQVIPFLVCEAVAVRREVRRDRPAVVHAHWILPQGLIATVAAPGIPRVVTSLGGDLYALRSKPLRAIKSFVVRRAAALTTVNSDMAAEVVRLGANASKVTVVPMGADLARFSPSDRVPAPEDGPLRLLFVGRLVEKKGLAVLLQALSSVDPERYELTVVGDGPLREELEKLADGLSVRFVGQHSRAALADDYRRNDVFVVPSVPASSGDQDGLPVALLEAMGSGCAIIASDLPGINEAIENEVSGVLVRPGDVRDLARAICELADNENLRKTLAQNAIERAGSFSVEGTGARYIDILNSVARAR